LHETSGFTPVGVFRKVGFKFGAWHDVGWWERDLGEGPSPPSEPVPFAEVAGDPALARALAAGATRAERERTRG
jgi:phosphinothricin acetyltransferase